MTAIEERLAKDLFNSKPSVQNEEQKTPASTSASGSASASSSSSSASSSSHRFFLSFFELFGSQSSDLLNNHEPVSIMEDKFGDIQIPGLKEVQVTSAEQFLALIAEVCSRSCAISGDLLA